MLVYGKLKTVCNAVYYEISSDDGLYPHIVFSCSDVDLEDLNRNDVIIDVDIWDKSSSALQVEELTDSVESLFNNKNLPQSAILPTFYLIDRKSVPDEDKTIRHRLVRIQAQNYVRG